MDNISVIIRNRNEERYIGYAIQSALDLFKNPEIIVIDDNSTDNSLEIVRTFTFSNIYIYKIDDYTPGKALNMGVKYSKNDNILVLSAHSEMIQIDYEKVLEQLKKYCAVFGRQIPIWNGKSITPRYIWSHFGLEEDENPYSKLENRYFLHNAFSFYKKDVLTKYPFDEKLSGKEDRYWVNDRVTEGMKFYYDPINVCKHHFTKNGATWRGMG
tara:strand:- start:1613 stop:2251 length:639 start_codon:yes stop_codon:yes gene_type:complete